MYRDAARRRRIARRTAWTLFAVISTALVLAHYGVVLP
jgi:hypothetical protein